MVVEAALQINSELFICFFFESFNDSWRIEGKNVYGSAPCAVSCKVMLFSVSVCWNRRGWVLKAEAMRHSFCVLKRIFDCSAIAPSLLLSLLLLLSGFFNLISRVCLDELR